MAHLSTQDIVGAFKRGWKNVKILMNQDNENAHCSPFLPIVDYYSRKWQIPK